MIILDTDHVSLVQRVDSPEGLRVRARILQLPPDEMAATTIVTYEEQMRGWLARMARARNIDEQVAVYDRLVKHIADYRIIRVLPFDRQAAGKFKSLRALRLRLGTCDLKIASIALAGDSLVLSRNLRDFTQIPNLRVQDWTQ